MPDALVFFISVFLIFAIPCFIHMCFSVVLPKYHENKANKIKHTLTDSDEHEGKLMLFVESVNGRKKENRVIISNKHQVQKLNMYAAYIGNKTATVHIDRYGRQREHSLELVRVFDAYWLDTGDAVKEELAENLVKQYGIKERIKKRIEEGAKLIHTYKDELTKLPENVGGE